MEADYELQIENHPFPARYLHESLHSEVAAAIKVRGRFVFN